jgi:Domain of unknown function (DUF4321)
MRKSVGTISLILFLGLIIGAVFSEIIALFLDKGTIAHDLFVSERELIKLDVRSLDLVVLTLTFGFSLTFNLMSVVGVFVASQMLRWYR